MGLRAREGEGGERGVCRHTNFLQVDLIAVPGTALVFVAEALVLRQACRDWERVDHRDIREPVLM